jgi:hypothetical protein
MMSSLGSAGNTQGVCPRLGAQDAMASLSRTLSKSHSPPIGRYVHENRQGQWEGNGGQLEMTQDTSAHRCLGARAGTGPMRLRRRRAGPDDVAKLRMHPMVHNRNVLLGNLASQSWHTLFPPVRHTVSVSRIGRALQVYGRVLH